MGFDQTLDVIAEVILALGESEKRPILTALGNQNLRVPIRGTFAEPKVELGQIASGNANWMNLLQTAGTLWAKRSAGGTGETTPEAEPEATGEAGIDAADVLDNLPVGNGEILNWWNERRKQREAERQAAEQQNPRPRKRRRPRDADYATACAAARNNHRHRRRRNEGTMFEREYACMIVVSEFQAKTI